MDGPAWQRPLRWLTVDLQYMVFYLPKLRDRPRGEQIESGPSMALWSRVTVGILTGHFVDLLVLLFIPCRLAILYLAWAFDYLPHHGLHHTPTEDRLKTTRNRVGLERLISPVLLYQNYHLVHHLHPMVPFYRYLAVWRRNEERLPRGRPGALTVGGRELTPDEYRRMRDFLRQRASADPPTGGGRVRKAEGMTRSRGKGATRTTSRTHSCSRGSCLQAPRWPTTNRTETHAAVPRNRQKHPLGREAGLREARDTSRAMSQETLNLFREAVDAFNRRDRAAWLALCDPQYENVPPKEWPESASIRGREAIWDFFISNMEPWEQGSMDIGEVIDAGDGKVVGELRTVVRGQSSGAQVEWCYWQVATYRSGKAVHSEWFSAWSEALASVDLQD